eukprot:jgi/Mesvir1/12957/Mv05970-RA.1
MGKTPNHKSKGTKGSKGLHKKNKRATFLSRGIDQVYDDLKQEEQAPGSTTVKLGLGDEDRTGLGRFYCVACSRDFQSAKILEEHEKTKPHKKKLKSILKEKPHSQRDAEMAAGMGKPDNGAKIGAGKDTAIAMAS